MSYRYTRNGQQVLLDGEHFADAASETAAMMILNALLALDERRTAAHKRGVELTSDPDELRRWMLLDTDGKAVECCVDPLRNLVSNPSIVIEPKHNRRREADEYACSCGLRWSVGEDDPH